MRHQMKKDLASVIIAKSLLLLVPEERIELSWAQGPEDFESSASTNFTTPAFEMILSSCLVCLFSHL